MKAIIKVDKRNLLGKTLDVNKIFKDYITCVVTEKEFPELKYMASMPSKKMLVDFNLNEVEIID